MIRIIIATLTAGAGFEEGISGWLDRVPRIQLPAQGVGADCGPVTPRVGRGCWRP